MGYAPAAWTTTYEHLKHLGYSDEVLETAGLAIRTRRNTLVDRFRDRITFGIRDKEGRLRGFTARCAPGASTSCPKYLNSPATPIYDKRELLFGLGEGQHVETWAGTTVLVEGPLDAISIASGTAAASSPYRSLALCGSQLTSKQASIACSRPTTTLVIALDGDDAGRQALYRTYKALAPRCDGTLCVARSSAGDPADVLATHGTDGVRRLVESAVPALDAVIDDLIGTWPTRGMGAEADLCCLRSAAAQLVGIERIDIAATAQRLADHLSLGHSTVTRELADAARLPTDTTFRSTHGRRQGRRDALARTAVAKSAHPVTGSF